MSPSMPPLPAHMPHIARVGDFSPILGQGPALPLSRQPPPAPAGWLLCHPPSPGRTRLWGFDVGRDPGCRCTEALGGPT